MLLAPATANAGKPSKVSPKVDRALQSASKKTSGPQRVIIRVKPGQRAAIRQALKNHGDKVYADHGGIESFSAEIHAEDLAVLAANGAIESISVDADLTALGSSRTTTSTTTTSTMAYTSVSSLLTTLGLGDFGMGASIGVAVLDSGLQDDGNFTGRIMEFHDFTGLNPAANTAAYDDYGHGSHVAGLIGSSGVTSLGKYEGVTQKVRLLVLKVLDRHGRGKTSTLIDAIEYVIANKDRLGVQVINLSLGHPIYESAATDPLVQEVERAVRAGLIVVAAAGNIGTNPTTGQTGYAGITSPGNAPSAITVGASKTFNTPTRGDDRVAAYSSRGPSWYDGFAKPDIVAPGQSLISDTSAGGTLALDYPNLVVTDSLHTYMKLSGSSMSTGVVSGLVALMLETNRYGAYERAKLLYGGKYMNSGQWVPPPYPTANAIKAMLQYSATRLHDDSGVEYDSLTQGAGEVNGLGALLLAYSTDTTKPIGSTWVSTTFDPHTTFGTELVTWGQKVFWGTHIASGAAIITVRQQAWDPNVVWGSGDGDNVVWGSMDENDNVVWGSNDMLDDNVVWGSDIVFDDNVVWGSTIWSTNVVWGDTLIGFFDGSEVMWGSLGLDNVVWGSLDDDNLVWGSSVSGPFWYIALTGAL
jgi:serine protease AprX